MTTYVTGLFIAAGNCPPEEQVDPREDLARVLIVMPKSILRDVQRLPMYEEVTVIPTAELGALRADKERLDFLDSQVWPDGKRTDPTPPIIQLVVKRFFHPHDEWANCAQNARATIDAAMRADKNQVTTKHTKDTKGETG